MTVLMRILGAANGSSDIIDGYWLMSYDPDADDGVGRVIGTTRREEAMRFPNMGAAMALWKKTSSVRPLRPDGKPNRPLTAFTVSIEDEKPTPPASAPSD